MPTTTCGEQHSAVTRKLTLENSCQKCIHRLHSSTIDNNKLIYSDTVVDDKISLISDNIDHITNVLFPLTAVGIFPSGTLAVLLLHGHSTEPSKSDSFQ